ncbi:hypothetical protein ACVME8_000139 [Bradyrhizobium diazoefficiens]
MAATLRFPNSKRLEEGTMQEPSKTTTALPRRAVLAGLVAAAPVTAVACLPTAAAAMALASPADDAALLQLNEDIFQAWEASHAHDDEIYRLEEVRKAEYERLLEQETAQGQYISVRERWDLVYSTPEVQRLDQLVILSEQHFLRMADLIDKMWAIPAKTEAGRSAKVQVLLSCVLNWRDPDEEMDWQLLMARRLLVDLVGGEEAESFREIYA